MDVYIPNDQAEAQRKAAEARAAGASHIEWGTADPLAPGGMYRITMRFIYALHDECTVEHYDSEEEDRALLDRIAEERDGSN